MQYDLSELKKGDFKENIHVCIMLPPIPNF